LLPDDPPEEEPALVIVVSGGPDESTLWRGWPVFVRVLTLTGDPPSALLIEGPSVVSPVRVEHGWILSATVTASLAPGAYRFAAGTVVREVTVADPPANLEPGQEALRWQIAGWVAQAEGDAVAELAAANAWAAAEPRSVDAQIALGDAHRRGGDLAAALDAYERGLGYWPGTYEAPRALWRKIGEVQRELVARAPVRTAAAPTEDENAYYALIDAGDAARESGNRAEAIRLYSEAAALHAARGLTISRGEADEKRALLEGGVSGGTVAAPPAAPSPGTTPVASPSRAAPAPGVPASTVAPPAAIGAPYPVPSPVISTQPDGRSEVVADERRFLNDPRGQWAASAVAGSQYGAGDRSAARAAGPPDVPEADDHPNAWCPARRVGGTEWLELAYDRPVHATEVRVRQSFGACGIVRIEGFDTDGDVQQLWSGRDPRASEPAREIVWFVATFPRTARPIVKLRLTVDLDAHSGWKQIDAVQLVGSP